jgi:hypothetical protein
MLRHNDLNVHFGSTINNRGEVVNLEPQQDSVSIRPVVTIRDRTMVMFGFEAV